MTTSMCTHETANCLAVVGSGPKGDLKIIRLSADGQELIATRSIRTKAPGYDVCWMKSTILVASNKHSVNLIRMDPALQTKPMDAASEDGIKWDEVYKLPDDSSTSSSKQVMPPGKYPISNRISRVEINPSAENIFGVVENNNFHLWEIENKSEPFHSDQASHTLLTSFDWSPHSVNMMSIAGAAKSVKIFDTRQLSSNSKRGNVWKVSNAHNDVIRCVKWNPLIPHWLASAGDDGLIKVWDTRMNRTSASITLQGHQNAVNSISWCPIRCEILISGGSDHSARLWDLGLHPHNTLASFNKEWTDAIVSSEFIRGRAQSFAFLSGSGQLRAFEITLDFAKSLTQTLDSSSNSALSELEALIFVRDYPTAFEKASKVAEKSIADGKMDETELVLSFCDTEVQDSPENFDAALDLYVRSIPPNLPYMYSPKRVNPDVISKLAKMKDHLHFKKTILQLAQAKDIDGLVSIEKEFFERISIDKTVADMNLITNILKTIIEADYLKGLQAGLRYAEILLKSDLYEEYAMVGHLLLYPTIMDECFNSILTPKLGVHPNADEIVLSSFRNLLGKLKDPSVVNVQVQLLGDVHMALKSSNPSAQVVKVMEGKKSSSLIAASLIRIYFHALIFEKRFDVFFIEAMSLTKISSGNSFGMTLENLIEDIAYPRLRNYLKEYTANSMERIEIRSFTAPTSMLVRLLHECPTLHEKILKVLARELGTITNVLDQTLTRMVGNIITKHEAVSQSKELYSSINRVCSNTSETRHPQVVGLLAILEKYAHR